MEKNKLGNNGIIDWLKDKWAHNPMFSTLLALLVMVLIQSVVMTNLAGSFAGMFGKMGMAWLNILRNNVFAGIIALGMCFAIISGGIDLSVGSVFALAAIICAELIMAGMNTVLAVLIALVAGTALGLLSGFLVAKCRLQAFIATLITMTAYRGVAYIITDGKPISRLAESAVSGSFFFKALGKGNLLIFKLRPQNSRCVQKLIFSCNSYPLLCLCNSRSVPCFGGCSA